jgi:hypothetical protein
VRRWREECDRDFQEWHAQWQASHPDEVDEGANAAKPRKHKPTLVGVARQARKAGLEVARYEIEPDGKISVVTGKPEPEQTNDLDKWLAKRHAH